MKILNIAAGKFDPILNTEDSMIPKFTVNVDTSYYSKTTPDAIEIEEHLWKNDPDAVSKNFYLNLDVFEFMERTKIKFDRAVIYRFLEHVSFTQIEYFIYLISTVLNKGAMVDVIVPNYTILAEMILNEENNRENPSFNFQAHNILLTTELLNEPSCPHASIWTKERMKYFWELEGRFKVKSVYPAFPFDGRDIYIRALMERV